MTGYGPPPGPPAPPPRPPMSRERLGQVLGYSAGGLGVLSFIWGFLDWYTSSNGFGGSANSSGYSGVGAPAAIGLSMVAGLLAAAWAFENKPASVEPFVFAVTGLLVVFGFLVDNNASTGVGMILALITAIIQAGILGYLWLAATGRLPAPRPPQPPPGQWQQQGPPPGYQQPPPGYQGPPPGYQGPPPGQR